MRIPEHLYAKFAHQGHVSTVRGTMNAIWNSWLPQSGYVAADAPGLERYDERFNPDLTLPFLGRVTPKDRVPVSSMAIQG
ncbi:MAG: hypothetical protein E6G89_02200 [Alphaproteobacteria bacterium]|nr:MAG: hypothetical protein E6G89_02200 [Alphaproteobacteria bacterium]